MKLAIAKIAMLAAVAACGSPSHSAPDGGGPPAPDAGIDGRPLGDPFAALQALPPVCSGDGWCWRSPTPNGNDLHRVFASAPDNVWLLGQHGTVMQWDGQAWTTHHPAVMPGQPAAHRRGRVRHLRDRRG